MLAQPAIARERMATGTRRFMGPPAVRVRRPACTRTGGGAVNGEGRACPTRTPVSRALESPTAGPPARASSRGVPRAACVDTFTLLCEPRPEDSDLLPHGVAPMDAIALLKQDHKTVKSLLAELADTT